MLQRGKLYRIILPKTAERQSDCPFMLLKPFCGQQERVASESKKLWLWTGRSSQGSQMSLSKWHGIMWCHWRAHALLFHCAWKIVQNPWPHREISNLCLCLLVEISGQDMYVNMTTSNRPRTWNLIRKFWESLGLIQLLCVSLSKKKRKRLCPKTGEGKNSPSCLLRFTIKC